MPDGQRFQPHGEAEGHPGQHLAPGRAGVDPAADFSVRGLRDWPDKLEGFMALPMGTTESGLTFISASLMELFWKAAGVFLVFGSVELFRQMRKHSKQLKMSKQKSATNEGSRSNPQMKAKIRDCQRTGRGNR